MTFAVFSSSPQCSPTTANLHSSTPLWLWACSHRKTANNRVLQQKRVFQETIIISKTILSKTSKKFYLVGYIDIFWNMFIVKKQFDFVPKNIWKGCKYKITNIHSQMHKYSKKFKLPISLLGTTYSKILLFFLQITIHLLLNIFCQPKWYDDVEEKRSVFARDRTGYFLCVRQMW